MRKILSENRKRKLQLKLVFEFTLQNMQELLQF